MERTIIVIEEYEYKTAKEQERKIKEERAKHSFGPEPIIALIRDFSNMLLQEEFAAHIGRASNCKEMQ